VQALDAARYQVIFIETVGAGQAEVEIARLAHTTLVVEAPGLGDDIQAIKAGMLEIADILIVNKADRPGADSTERALRSMLQLGHPSPRVFQNHLPNKPGPTMEGMPRQGIGPEDQDWIPPIHRTVATEGIGVLELARAINHHYEYLQTSGELGKRDCARLRSELDLLLRETLVTRWRRRVPDDDYERALERLVSREISLWHAVDLLIDGGNAQ
jgi:LAO/AO transport system kinase